jgi:hypothetical protein
VAPSSVTGGAGRRHLRVTLSASPPPAKYRSKSKAVAFFGHLQGDGPAAGAFSPLRRAAGIFSAAAEASSSASR